MISCLIVYKEDTLERKRNVLTMIDWYSSLGMEIILIEQNKNPTIQDELPSGISYLFLYNPYDNYNMSWAFNVGVKRTQCDVIFFSNCDTLIQHQDLENALRAMDQYDSVIPCTKRVDLNQVQSEEFVRSQELRLTAEMILGIREEEDRYQGGMQIMKKSTILHLGGWPEEIEGWGLEDTTLVLKTRRMGIKQIVFRNYGFHLFHPVFTESQHPFYAKSKALYEAIKTMGTQQLQQYCQYHMSNMGNSKRYATSPQPLEKAQISFRTNLYHLFGDLWRYVVLLDENQHIMECLQEQREEFEIHYPIWVLR